MNKFFLPLIMAFILVSCGVSDKNNSLQKKNTFCITDTMMRYLSFYTVKKEQYQNDLMLSGKVQAIPSKNIKIYPLVNGIVKNVFVELGDYVREGQTIAILQSGEVAGFERELADAEANLEIAQKNAEVAKEMFKSKLISEKEYIASQREVIKAEAELKRLKTVFSIYDVNQEGLYVLKSPISGYISTKNISPGMQILAGGSDELFTIADIDEVWVVAGVYESDLNKVKIGQEVEIQTIAYPDTVFRGKVDKIFEILDPVTKVMKVSISIPNPNHLLKPEMYARVKLFYKENSYFPCVPFHSVIFENGRYYVIVFKDKCHVEVRNVEKFDISGDKFYVKNLLNEGEVILNKNQLLIYDALTDQ